MKFQDIRDLSKEDILDTLGLARKQTSTEWALGTFGLFGLGLLVGASVALILAPKAGSELRSDLTQKLRTVRNSTSSGESPTSESAI